MSKQAKITGKGAKSVSLMPTTWDTGATGPANRENLVEEPASEFDPNTGRETRNPNGVTRQRRKTMIAVYAKHLTPAQQAAAFHFYNASLGNPDRDPIAAIGDVRSTGGDPQVTAIDKRREFLALWKRVPIASRPVVERVVLDDLPIWKSNEAQRERHMQRLRVGLDAIG